MSRYPGTDIDTDTDTDTDSGWHEIQEFCTKIGALKLKGFFGAESRCITNP
jgi:hypothetical protein